ncbi:MAG: Unknown protein [uncultured Sulfurovum sp.]|uniref:Uncharacterized protein n=1 Tax=uncultured Sulfurovum sp. TaxID=269237 RepID=A0A6S6RX74_9BACT|nr:MAG: Unknown protein [uncultured Sulfurovum sp.]
MIKKIFALMVVLGSVLVCGEEQEEKKMHSILEDKPSFSVRMETEYSNFIVTLNGVKVFKELGGSPTILEVPVNHLMTSGDNELKVQLIAWDDTDYKLHKELLCKVSLRVKKYDDFSIEPKTISTITYNNKQEKALKTSSLEGKYNSKKDFLLDEKGDVVISDIETSPLTFYQGDKIAGVNLTQNINLETPFPRWKFLDSENIIEKRYDELSNDEYNKLRETKDIKEFFTVHKKIYDALMKKDVDSIIDMFDERNSEMDIAMYYKNPYYKNRLYEKLKKNVNDDSRELLKWDESKMYFFIEENGKLIYIDGAIAFNDKDGSTSTSYPMLFRKEKDKWIITR